MGFVGGLDRANGEDCVCRAIGAREGPLKLRADGKLAPASLGEDGND